MGEMWPNAWLDAAEAGARRPEKYVTVGQMRDLMAEHKVAGEKAQVLLQWLHERGDVVHFRDDLELNDLVLLKPHWVSQVISRVLDSADVKKSGGLFTRQHMDALWADVEPVMRNHLVRLMERFDLSYRTDQDRHTSLVVEALPSEAPAYQSAWESLKGKPRCNELAMTFRLSTIPAGIPTWFIAREHRYTANLHWRHGVLLADGEQRNHLGLIQARPEDRSVLLTVRGPFPQDFFALLRDGLEGDAELGPGAPGGYRSGDWFPVRGTAASLATPNSATNCCAGDWRLPRRNRRSSARRRGKPSPSRVCCSAGTRSCGRDRQRGSKRRKWCWIGSGSWKRRSGMRRSPAKPSKPRCWKSFTPCTGNFASTNLQPSRAGGTPSLWT